MAQLIVKGIPDFSAIETAYESLKKKIESKPITVGVGTGNGTSSGGSTKSVKAALVDVEQEFKNLEKGWERLETKYDKTNNKLVGFTATYRKSATEIERVTVSAGGVYKKNIEEAKKETNLLGDSIGNIVAKIVAWQVINAAVATTIRAFTEAVDTIKAVDTELTNIQKVSGMTAAEIKNVGEQAYKTAASYGVAVEDYLSSVATMSKAGFDNAEAMAELATKTQLVGDVTSDVADQFIISANAAFGFQGNVEELSEVLDKANVIENNFATSIESIAAGFPKVASVASMANMSIDELVAALGTITSVTQESGESAATALRALILNIMGDTETELEDGITWTKEEIDSLSQILWEYSEDAMLAAQATGEIVDPMEAVAGLSKAFKEGILTEKELADMASSLGGKLRTNQLLALVENYDMYLEMLEMTTTAAGSADEEVSIMLSSWESKTQVLKTTWAGFVSEFIDTDMVKDLLDIITGIVSGLSSVVGYINDIGDKLHEAEESGTWWGYALERIETMTSKLSKIKWLIDEISSAIDKFKSGDFWGGVSDIFLPKWMRDKLDVGGAVKELDAGDPKKLKDVADAAEDVATATNNAAKATKDLGNEASDTADELDDLWTALDKVFSAVSSCKDIVEEFNENGEISFSTLSDIHDKFGELDNIDDYIARLTDADLTADELSATLGEMTADMVLAKLATGELTAEDEALIAAMLKEAGVANSASVANALIMGYAVTGANNVFSLRDQVTRLGNTSISVGGITGAISNITSASSTAAQAVANLRSVLKNAQATGGLANAAAIYATKSTSTSYVTQEQLDAFKTILFATNNSINTQEGNTLYKALLDAKNSEGKTTISTSTKEKIMNRVTQYLNLAQSNYDSAVAKIVASNIENALGDLGNWGVSEGSGASYSGGTGASGGSSSSSSSSSSTDYILEAWKDRIELLKSELSLMEERGDEEEDIVAKQREIQNALKGEAEYLEYIGGYQADINDLYTEWWKIENDITELMESDQEEAAQKLLDIEEAKAEVLKKQLDLLDAQNERTVRIWNAKTSQWEWAANASSVKSAKESLEDAISSYSEAGGTESEILSPGILTSANAILRGATSVGGSSTSSAIYYNGDTYSIGGVTLTEGQAKSMTVYDLSQLARELTIRNEV